VIATRPRLRRALTTAAALPLLAVPLTACTNAETDAIYQPAQGANNRDGSIDVLNALIVSSEEGEGRFIAGLASTGQEPDELINVTSAGDSQVQVSLEPGDTQIPARGFLQLADDSAANITVQGEEVVAGGYVRLTLEFAQAEPAEVNVPVVAPGEDFADVASLTPSASPSESPNESPTESPTESE
jgi:hypothetical protein